MELRRVRVWKVQDRWVWECTLCQPPAMGSRAQWHQVLSSLRRHYRVRSCHHDWVRRNKGKHLAA
jgi:hypothetical protein